MDQPWWVYGAVALVCVILIIVVKVLEKKVFDDDMDLDMLNVGLGIVGALAAWGMLSKL